MIGWLVSHVIIDNNSVDITRGTTTEATFGATTTIGSSTGRHLKLTSGALEIKTAANTTVLSASAAGIEMSGSIHASAGTIGGFDIGVDKLSFASASSTIFELSPKKPDEVGLSCHHHNSKYPQVVLLSFKDS